VTARPRCALLAATLLLLFSACSKQAETPASMLQSYALVPLSVDLGELQDGDREALAQLKLAAAPVERIYWQQVFPGIAAVSRQLEQSGTPEDRAKLAFLQINYGPWDRLRNNRNFLGGEDRPPGAAFYPHDVGGIDFEEYLMRQPALKRLLESPTTLVTRSADGGLQAVPYEQAYKADLEEAAARLEAAAAASRRPVFRTFLIERARALRQGNYRHSDELWVGLREEPLDIVIGPIETSEDQLLGIKAAYQAAVLVRDVSGSRDLTRVLAWADEFLPALGFKHSALQHTIEIWQAALFTGQLNAGVKTVALTLPNDDSVRERAGTRKLIFSNVLRAKFRHVLRPLAAKLLDAPHVPDVTEAALFEQVLFHEACHEFQAGTDLAPLADTAPPLEELKADVLGILLASRVAERGMMTPEAWRRLRVAYLVGVLRAVRMGTGSAHAQANAIQLESLMAAKALQFQKGLVKLDVEKVVAALTPLAETLRDIEARADYAAARKLLEEKARVNINLTRRLISLNTVPVDVHFQYPD
jgi:hypothetical protein